MTKGKKMMVAALASGAVSVMIGRSATGADKLSAFKEADGYQEGCRTILVWYSSDRDSCITNARSHTARTSAWTNGKSWRP